jgi:hypothetical protein
MSKAGVVVRVIFEIITPSNVIELPIESEVAA